MLVAHGSRVRDLTVGAEVPDKDIIIAIVDGMDGEIGSGTGSEVSR